MIIPIFGHYHVSSAMTVRILISKFIVTKQLPVRLADLDCNLQTDLPHVDKNYAGPMAERGRFLQHAAPDSEHAA